MIKHAAKITILGRNENKGSLEGFIPQNEIRNRIILLKL